MSIVSVSTVASWAMTASAREAGYPASHAFDGSKILCGRKFDFQITGDESAVNCILCKRKLTNTVVENSTVFVRNTKRNKPQPVKPGEYEPLPFNAILSPDGLFYRADNWTHEKVAYAVTGQDWDDLVRNGWCRLSTGLVYFAYSYRNELTQPQIDAIYDYTQFLGWQFDEVFDTYDRAKAREQFGLVKMY